MTNTLDEYMILFERPEFHGEAACVGLDPNIFFPVGVPGSSSLEYLRPAKRICGSCPVRVKCLEWAIDNQEPYGIRGGIIEKHRDEWTSEGLTPQEMLDREAVFDAVIGVFKNDKIPA